MSNINIYVNGSVSDDLFVDEVDEYTNDNTTENVSCSVTSQNHVEAADNCGGATGSKDVIVNNKRKPEKFRELPRHFFADEKSEKRRLAEELYAQFLCNAADKLLFLDFVKDQKGKDIYEAVYNIRCEYFGASYFDFDEAVFEEMMKIDPSIRTALAFGHISEERKMRIILDLVFQRYVDALNNPCKSTEDINNLGQLYVTLLNNGYKQKLAEANAAYRLAQAKHLSAPQIGAQGLPSVTFTLNRQSS